MHLSGRKPCKKKKSLKAGKRAKTCTRKKINNYYATLKEEKKKSENSIEKNNF